MREGVSQLKEKWNGYNEPKRLRKLVSLFVSPTAKHVAVASGNRITILSKEDDYQQTYSIFTSEFFFEIITLHMNIIGLYGIYLELESENRQDLILMLNWFVP